jgi:hypothetical protein
MMAMIILMLNLLIALMGDVFSSVRAKGFAVWRKEQASIIIEEPFFFADEAKKVPPFLHVLNIPQKLVIRMILIITVIKKVLLLT